MGGIIVFLLILLNVVLINCLEPVLIAGGIGAFYLSVSHYFKSFLGHEYCDDKWIKLDITGLQSDLQRNVYGQHLVQSIVLKSLYSHMKENPRKALVLSFHGPGGTGKNFVSSFITKNLFKAGAISHYTHLYNGLEYAHNHLKAEYMEKLRYDVQKATQLCPRNLFIFDEVDKMVPGILDALSPYIDFYESLHGVDYRKNIFIFLSNSGAKNITKKTMEFLLKGKQREEITLRDIEFSIAQGAYHETGGLHNSDIVKRDRIDTYVPFLPLERKHVKDCIDAELKSKNKLVSTHIIDKIADEFVYIPEDKQLFSRAGCKKVHKTVELFVD